MLWIINGHTNQETYATASSHNTHSVKDKEQIVCEGDLDSHDPVSRDSQYEREYKLKHHA